MLNYVFVLQHKLKYTSFALCQIGDLSTMYPAYHPIVAGIGISRRDWMDGLVLCYMNRLDENIRLSSVGYTD